MKKFIFTCGDINGIGPELVIKALNRVVKQTKDKFVFICPENVFLKEISKRKPAFKFEVKQSADYTLDVPVSIISLSNYKQRYGIPTNLSGEASYKALEIAYKIAVSTSEAAIVTAPISKTAWAKSEIKYPGHTELFSDWCGVKIFAMMFLSKSVKASLLTIHLPIIKVPRSINKTILKNKFDLAVKTLKEDFKITTPKIAVLGLNPHAGENGLIGNEEIKIIIPFMKKYSKRKFFFGPFTPDGFWGNKMYMNYDLTLGMYHDQILNPFKLLNFNRGVNFTAGLPIVRTSPDHGTAYDIAGKGIADESSMIEAYRYAKLIVNNRISNAKHSYK